MRGVLLTALLASPAAGEEFKFRIQQVADRLGVGYAVTVVDMNGDEKSDIVVVDTDRVIWYENPGWQLHTLIQDQTKRDNVCIAPYDIDGDGRPEFALGADWRPFDTRTGGTIQWLSSGASPDARWEVHPIGEAPMTHRMRWADLDGDGRSELLVVPMMGGNTTKENHWAERGLQFLVYKIPADPVHDAWVPEVINEELHVAHNFWPTDLDRDGRTDILVASFEGVSWLRRGENGRWRRTQIGSGNQDNPAARGASEIKHGRLAGGGDYIATIEPWHGFQVVVYTPPTSGDALWRRQVLDERLKWGHAVWCANLDGDDDQELLVGVRDDKDEADRCGLRIYDPQDRRGERWDRQLVDPGGVNVEDLTAADLDGDGRQDIVAVGRQSHNLRIYWNETP